MRNVDARSSKRSTRNRVPLQTYESSHARPCNEIHHDHPVTLVARTAIPMTTIQKVVRRQKFRYGREPPPNSVIVPNPIQKARPPSKSDKTIAFPPKSLLIRKSIPKGIPLPKIDVPVSCYGQYIYLYANIQTSQVVYSLTRHLNVRPSLQLSSIHNRLMSCPKEQRCHRPTPLPRQKDRPSRSSKRSLVPPRNGLLSLPPRRP